MSATLSRLFFSFAVIIAAIIVFFCTTLHIVGSYSYGFQFNFAISSLITIIFFAVAWTLVWRKQIKWNARRIALTAGVFVAGVGPAILVLIQGVGFSIDLCMFLSLLTWAACWFIGTAIVWRETVSERAVRLRTLGVAVIACPSCGYNLTGLREARCPECGQTYTLDQLVSAIIEQRDESGRI